MVRGGEDIIHKTNVGEIHLACLSGATVPADDYASRSSFHLIAILPVRSDATPIGIAFA